MAQNPRSRVPPYAAFADSEFFTLQASGSTRHFKIHEALLVSTSDQLRSACQGGFSEQNERKYHFREGVPEPVLVAFIEWAYTRDYSDGSVRGPPVERDRPFVGWGRLAGQVEGLNLTGGLISAGPALETVAVNDQDEEVIHPLLLHVMMYTFGGRYFVDGLGVLAREKIIDRLKAIASLDREHEREAVLDLLGYAFENLREEDPLLPWLGMFASYRLEKLKQSNERLGDLLGCADGSFARHLIRCTGSTPHAPWDMQERDIIPNYPIPNGKKSGKKKKPDNRMVGGY